MSDYLTLENNLKNELKLEKEPVAVKIFEKEEDASAILPKFDGKARHCGMVYEAQNGKSFYSTIDEHTCLKGAKILGLAQNDNDPIVPYLEKESEAIAYAPLGEANFKADSVLIYVTPIQAKDLAKMYRVKVGKRFRGDFYAAFSLCSDATIIPMKTNEPNLTLGCGGSRKDGHIEDYEEVIGLTIDNLESLFDN